MLANRFGFHWTDLWLFITFRWRAKAGNVESKAIHACRSAQAAGASEMLAVSPLFIHHPAGWLWPIINLSIHLNSFFWSLRSDASSPWIFWTGRIHLTRQDFISWLDVRGQEFYCIFIFGHKGTCIGCQSFLHKVKMIQFAKMVYHQNSISWCFMPCWYCFSCLQIDQLEDVLRQGCGLRGMSLFEMLYNRRDLHSARRHGLWFYTAEDAAAPCWRCWAV